MKIVYLIAGTCNSGGMERVLAGKANWLVRHGHEVVIVTTDQRGRVPYFPLDPAIKTYDLGINYDENNGRSFFHKALYFPFKQWRHRQLLTVLLKELKADVVVCMFNNDVSFVCDIQDGSRKILEIHFSKQKKLQYGRRGLWRLADRWRTAREERIVRKYDRFVVLTHEDKALWGDLPNICVIPNSRPTSLPNPHSLRGEGEASGGEGSRYQSKRVVAVGRLDYQKGFDRLIDIWARVKRSPSPTPSVGGRDSWQLDIVGDGPLRDELQRRINVHSIGDSVHLLPPTSDILSLYLRSSILVMTSRYEGLPMVLIEAQSCGLPIVAYACKCGPRDVITDGIDGFLIPDGDEQIFAKKLLMLMSDETLRQRMGQAAAIASDRYSEERIMQQWDKLFSSSSSLLLSSSFSSSS